MLNYTDCKCFFLNREKITKKELNVIFSFKETNRIYNRRLLISFLLLKTTYVYKLNKIGLIRKEFNHLNIIYFSF
jgi:hypothetical protein